MTTPGRPRRSRRPRHAGLIAVCAAALTALPLAAAGVSASPLPHRAPAAPGEGKEVLRERTFPLRADAFRDLCTPAPFGAPREHTFVFFDNVHITAVEDGIDEDEGTLTWSGHVKGKPDHSVVLSMRGVCSTDRTPPGTLVVEVLADLGERVYRLVSLPGDEPRVRATEEDPDHRPRRAPDELLPGTVAAPPSATRKKLQGRAAATPANPVVIDVIAGYTPKAVAAAGGEQQVINTINWAERKMNEALADSNVAASIDIIGTYNTRYTGDNTSSVMHAKLSDPANGELGATAADLRRRYGVDLVTVVNSVNPGQSSGQGSLPTLGSFDSKDAFSVVDLNSLTGWYNLGHEIGHNLGLFHDRRTLDQQIRDGSWRNLLNTPSGTGWITPNEEFHTLMAYSTSCFKACTAVNQYSNTENTVDGQPLGDRNNDNAALARLSTPIVAGYRTLTTPRTRYALTLLAGEGGSVRPAVFGPYKPGTVVGVTARPQQGYRLAAWIYDGVQYNPSAQVNVTMDAAHTLEAVFLPL
ncbi:reprolysin-like metallopeptidase [Streptomyces sp. NPDC001674]|uniref:InlB B-repeat-containing protein n=1 Tax=Streptomyces sp. NPDC001674 TaxID=3154394 RepID=UPI003322E9D1